MEQEQFIRKHNQHTGMLSKGIFTDEPAALPTDAVSAPAAAALPTDAVSAPAAAARPSVASSFQVPAEVPAKVPVSVLLREPRS